MEYNELFKIVKELEFDKRYTVYQEGDIEIYILRPSKVFKTYDKNKNFQIFIKERNRDFRPNHLRVMVDLHLRVRSRPDLKNELLIAFDKIFNKENSFTAIKNLIGEDFEHSLNPLKVIAILDQLFLIEQEHNYTKPSNYDPVTLFYQGWIRQSIDGTKEIDNLVMSICRFQPPASKYTSKDNIKHKNYSPDNKQLWYLE
jgi:hypothetical protein